MPVLVNYNKCKCAPLCFAANACPKDALRVDKVALKVTVEPELCGDCPAPCLNFCDAVALKYAPNLEELAILQQELNGELTAEQVVEARKKVQEEMKLKAEALAQAEEEQQVVEIKPITITTDTFVQEVLQAEVPVLVDFWAAWCGPCKQIAPIVEDLAKEFAGRLKVGKMNVDEEPAVAGQLGIQSIPTLVIFYGGQLADMIVGAVDKASLRNRVTRVLDAIAQYEAQQGGGAPQTAASQKRPNLVRAQARPNRPLK